MATIPTDWHPARVVYELRLRGQSLRKLSRENGYSANSGKNALRAPWPRMEALIAKAIGVKPAAIWPTRYRRKRLPLREVGTASRVG